MTARSFRNNRPLQLLVLWLVVVWVITAIEPFNRRDWFLENILVFIYGALLVMTYRRFAFSNLTYMLFGVFITLHLYGAHYTYTETPFGHWLQASLDLSRNHYDRIVHFSYGLLTATAFREVLIRVAGIRVSWSYFMAVVSVLAFSAFYEFIEGAVAMVVSPDLGNAYLGTQGDVWDAEKDTFLAFTGAIIAMAITWLHNAKKTQERNK